MTDAQAESLASSLCSIANAIRLAGLLIYVAVLMHGCIAV